ncbi:MAG: amine dehydrogenase [Gammaproteobacteria bacterium]|jgi:methylamine dehydrogenase heavy chain|nr:amine dehydrogenase [Gammaproteobacteria bacterium]
MKKRLCIFLLICLGSPWLWADVPNDKMGVIGTLPATYPDHWVLAHDVGFNHMLNGKVIILDAEQETRNGQFKGTYDTSLIAAVAIAKTRPEMYVYETFYTRGNRGARTDVVTIYDKASLNVLDEIIIPGGKRAQLLPSDFTIRLIDDEKLLLLYNFTPSTSISVVDIVSRKILNEINLPACSLIYPTGKRGFSSLCSDASMMSYQLDKNGKVKSKSKIDSFFDIDKDALFERPAIIDGVAYFPTFNGNLREVDLTRDKAVPGASWSLLTDKERAANWRPGGMQVSGSDSLGNMYFLMHENGAEGTHKNPGMEVWVFDAKNRKRVNRIPLQLPGLVIELSQDKSPWLYVTNVEMNIDVYDAISGKYIRTLSDFGQETPLILFSTN